MNKDPILESLARIEAKQDLALRNQEKMEQEIAQIHQTTKRTAAVTGSVAGGVAGGVVATAIALFKAKVGL